MLAALVVSFLPPSPAYSEVLSVARGDVVKVMEVARERLAAAAGFWEAMEGARCPVVGFSGWREWRAATDEKVAFPRGVPLLGLVKGEGGGVGVLYVGRV